MLAQSWSTTRTWKGVCCNMSETAFKQCSGCGVTWETRDDFLADPDVGLTAYTVNFEQLVLGLFQFQHACGTGQTFRAEKFMDLYDGPVFQQRKTGSQDCPALCLHQYELGPCPSECECASVREVMCIIRHWPGRLPSAHATGALDTPM